MSDSKTCFIITPIGGDESTIRRHADGVIDAVISPLLNDLNFEIVVAHKISKGGNITRQVIENIIESDLVIANLTGLNPNVMYELAVRHAVRKPLVQICEKTTDLPFDINQLRTIFYTNDMKGVVELKENLEAMIHEALIEEKPENPIYSTLESISILKNPEVSQPEKYILERFNELERTVMRGLKTFAEQKYFVKYQMNEQEKSVVREVINDLINRQGSFNLDNLEKELINRNIHIPRDMIRDSVNELIYQDS